MIFFFIDSDNLILLIEVFESFPAVCWLALHELIFSYLVDWNLS